MEVNANGVASSWLVQAKPFSAFGVSWSRESMYLNFGGAMEPLGHINRTETVKVQRPTAATGPGKNWMIFDESRKQVESRDDSLISPRVKEALGAQAEGYFQGTWSAAGWKIGDRLLPKKW